MKKISLILAFLLFSLFSCTKDNGTSSQIITYSLQGLTDLTIGSTNSASFVLNFHATGNLHEKVSLSFTGLPSGITVDTNHISSGTPDFGSFITFTNDGTTLAGTYNVTLHCIGSVSGERTFRFLITISSSNNSCISPLLGLYTNCNLPFLYSHSGLYEDIVIPDPNGINNRIIFQHFDQFGVLYADVNCSAQSITVPYQNESNSTFNGYGYYSGNNITIHIYRYNLSNILIDTAIMTMAR